LRTLCGGAEPKRAQRSVKPSHTNKPELERYQPPPQSVLSVLNCSSSGRIPCVSSRGKRSSSLLQFIHFAGKAFIDAQ
jgi:hypothetical protein